MAEPNLFQVVRARRAGYGTINEAPEVEVDDNEVEQPPRTFIVWFTLPYIGVKLLQLVLSVVVLVLMFVWNSRGISLINLVTTGATDGFDSYRSEVYCFVGLSILSILYSSAMVLIGLCRVKLRAIALTLLPSVGFFLWLFAAPFMSYVVRQLQNALWARRKGLDTAYLSIATGLGFGIMILFVFDSFLGFVHLQAGEEAKRAGVVTPAETDPAGANRRPED